ncbi:hypothetical protein NLJ89_g9573 [Agrocybe chaxingu]|uniref:KOW domain-containing protein n=1 Tax=Agrocybe chaxingu TaxID=84603 RepID=A0A9W8JVL4_9AGAR|nr:hypothetical protein NLJ89_g9573 [Agrocybe chaxingu]
MSNRDTSEGGAPLKKRRRLNPAMFVDIEAGVTDDEEEYVRDETEDEDEHEREEDIYDDVQSYIAVTQHSRLMQSIDDAGEDAWEELLERARERGRSSSVMEGLRSNEEVRLEGNDRIFEIGCLVGHEESTAFKVLSLATHPTFPQILARSITARSTIPGRIYAEVDSMDQARALARRISELDPSNIRPVSMDERTEMLTRASPYRPEDQKWVRVRDKRAKWKKYRGDTGLLIKRKEGFLVGLIPRIGKEPRPPQALAPHDDMVKTFGVRKVKSLEVKYIFEKCTYTQEGILLVPINEIDLIITSEILPCYHEFPLFCDTSLLEDATRLKTLSRVSQKRLQIQDRVKVIRGEFAGVLGEVVEVGNEEVLLHLPSQNIVAPFSILEVRPHFKVGDHVAVTHGKHKGVKGWVTFAYADTLIVHIAPEREASSISSTISISNEF